MSNRQETQLRISVHLENLRIKYDLSQESLCKGICTLKQYNDFIEKNDEIKSDQLVAFCNNLDISLSNFYQSYHEQDELDYLKVYELYSLIKEKKYDKFYLGTSIFDETKLLSDRNRKFYQYCTLKADFVNKRQNPVDIYNSLSNLIDYPECLMNNSYDFIELFSLTLIAEIEVNNKIQKALLRLLEILANNKILFTSYDKLQLLPLIYANSTLFLCRLEKYEFCSDFALEGIRSAQKYDDMSSLTLLRYLRAFSLLQLGFEYEAETEAVKCLLTAVTSGSSSDKATYYHVIEKDFEINPNDLISKYKDEILL